ncbi:FAD-binding oxidoreductase [Myxococcota bacterium]|nr:FAD-binding oxidoreductase [Myxococcota bacterium]MBU1534095.1 FAD-binding oxidoreductase [Myxococcota bacterium]
MNATFDVIVVGAGSVGNPTALALAQQGMKVLVLEKRSAPGMGDNKAAIGGVRATHSDPAKIQTCIASLKVFSTWEETYGHSIGWKTGGYCFPVYTESLENTLKGYLPIQKRFGLEIEWISREGIREIVPGINGEGLLGGTYSPGDGQVSPLKMAAEVAREALALGVVYRFNEAVTGYEIEAGSIRAVRTAQGRYEAPVLVVASGADAREHGVMLGVDLPVFPDSHEAGISAPIAPFLAPLVVDMRPGVEGRTANFYFGQGEGGQIIFCYTPKTIFPGHDRQNLAEFMPTLASRLITLIPRFRNLLIRRIWRGLYPMTPDGVPIVDSLKEVQGVYVAVGMCGQGFMMGPGLALSLASRIVHGEWTLEPEVQKTFSLYRDFGAKTEALK